MEDLAYRRMLDLYYRTEKHLPASVEEIARLIRMRDFQAAIRDVLNEFFVLYETGWHNKRADQELTNMLTKQEQQATKDAHEAERMKRHRERRAEMFAALRAVNVVPAWDVAIKELQRLHDTHCNAPETRTGALPVTDLQRLSLPTPTPIPIVERTRRASRLPTDWTLPAEWRDWSKAERPDLDPTKVAERFRDFWVAKAGRDGAKLDWQATWRNWVRAQTAMNGRNNGPSPGAGDIWAGAV
jgi:uncharacterized protein YdaU (DUF1376 family)